MRVFTSFVLALSSLSLVACGDDGGDPPSIDAPAANCTVSSNAFGSRGALQGNSTYTEGATAGIGDMRAILPLEAAPPSDILIVEFYTGFAPFGTSGAPTAVVPGTYQISGDQLNYATCGVCVRIGTNADTQGYEDDYLATGGTVTVTTADSRVGGTLAFSVSNLTFEHVTIDENTFQSTPVGDGCNSAIGDATHTSTLAAPPAKRAGVAQQVVIPLGKRVQR